MLVSFSVYWYLYWYLNISNDDWNGTIKSLELHNNNNTRYCCFLTSGNGVLNDSVVFILCYPTHCLNIQDSLVVCKRKSKTVFFVT